MERVSYINATLTQVVTFSYYISSKLLLMFVMSGVRVLVVAVG